MSCANMPVIATANIKDEGIFNSMEFKIRDFRYVDEDHEKEIVELIINGYI